MSSESNTEPAPKQSADEIQADIEATRERLAASVDALSDKLDVKAHAEEAVHEAGAKVQATVSSAASSAAEGSRTLVARFRALPMPAQAAIVGGAVAVLVTVVVRSARD